MSDPAYPQPATSWVDFFDRHAPTYLQNPFTQNTQVEVPFLIEVMELQPGMRLLDVGCGAGRHAVEFAARGYRVTGVDFSPGMLREARALAERRGVTVDWIHADATTWTPPESYDAAICLCEGGLGLIGRDEDPVQHDLGILRTLASALPAGAPFAITALNGYSLIRRMTDDHVQNGVFNPITMVAQYVDQFDLPDGPEDVAIRERLFIPPEMVAMLYHAGLVVEHVYGGTAGEWGKRPLRLDEIEAMYLGRRR